MKLAACILTRNQYANERRDLFERTVDSLRAANIDLYVVDNHSDDGTDKLLASSRDWHLYRSDEPNTTSGFGTWTSCRILAGSTADICIVSDDDMEWTAGFASVLTNWWEGAPDNLVLTGGHIEPEFFWNAITTHKVYGGVHGLLRESTGAASWTFRRTDFERFTRIARQIPIDRQGVWDVPMCQGLRQQWLIGQVDVAEHIGQGRSSWGNGTADMYGWDVEQVRSTL